MVVAASAKRVRPRPQPHRTGGVARRGLGAAGRNVAKCVRLPTPFMSTPYRVALLGFSDFERSALASFFRLAQRRVPAYAQVELPADADILIVDGDLADAVSTAKRIGRVHQSVFVGAQAPDDAGAWMSRPIDPLHVMRELDVMVVLRQATPGAPERQAPPAERPWIAPPSLDDPLDSGPGMLTADFGAPAEDGTHNGDTLTGVLAALPPQLRAMPTQPGALRSASAPDRGHALIVDDSEIALRFMERHLLELGLTPHRALNSDRALDLLNRHAFRLVLLDVELGEDSTMDGLALCHHIRHAPVVGRSAPLVVMVSAHHDEVDRVRGTLAGCDAYLEKPLNLPTLRQLLARHGIVRRASHGD
jgi:CheY-like chemotaxis protein